MASWEQGLYFVFHPTPATENEIREMSEALPPDVGENGAAAGLPLIPELETYRAGFRWAKTEILHLTGSLDELTYNRRPRPDAWSQAWQGSGRRAPRVHRGLVRVGTVRDAFAPRTVERVASFFSISRPPVSDVPSYTKINAG